MNVPTIDFNPRDWGRNKNIENQDSTTTTRNSGWSWDRFFRRLRRVYVVFYCSLLMIPLILDMMGAKLHDDLRGIWTIIAMIVMAIPVLLPKTLKKTSRVIMVSVFAIAILSQMDERVAEFSRLFGF